VAIPGNEVLRPGRDGAFYEGVIRRGGTPLGVRIDLYDSSSDYEASGIDGLEMQIHANAHDKWTDFKCIHRRSDTSPTASAKSKAALFVEAAFPSRFCPRNACYFVMLLRSTLLALSKL
jgi:hypothetical protein